MSGLTVYRAKGSSASAAFLLAHGAGAGQRHPFIVECAKALANRGLDVLTFDFPYITAGRRIPDRGPVLHARYREAVDEALQEVDSAARCLVIGGKSMGGRIATEIAAETESLPIRGLVMLGYPLHPPGRPDQLRDRHLASIHRPMLVVQGSRDTFGTPPELESVLRKMSPTPTLHVVEGGDHSFKLSRRDPAAQRAVYEHVHGVVFDWIERLSRS